MVAELPLQDLMILVTRPEQQADTLCDLIAKAGGMAIRFPVIEIVSIARQQWSDLDMAELDFIIFVSRNAVNYFMAGLTQNLPAHVQFAAVGDGTAESMMAHGLRVDIQPARSTGTDGLLLMPQLMNIFDKQIAIVRGRGGRELLAQTLVARGANIRYIEVYERVLPTPTTDQCVAATHADSVVCTSITGIDNLSLLLKDKFYLLLTKPLIVLSERIKQHALLIGFQHVSVTEDASDKSIMQQLIGMK